MGPSLGLRLSFINLITILAHLIANENLFVLAHRQTGETKRFFEPLEHNGSLLWTCQIKLGSPIDNATSSGQTFRVLVDTGSSDLWLTSTSCTSELCLARQRFDPAKSTSLEYSNNRTIQINYGGDLEVKGVEVKDRLQIGDMTIDRQSVLLAESLAGRQFGSLKFDGILGLGSKFDSKLKALTPFEQMIEDNLIAEPVFSIYLNPTKSSGLLFGSKHRNYSSDSFRYAPRTSNIRWQIQLFNVSLKSWSGSSSSIVLSVCNRRCEALVDSGTPLILGSRADVLELNSRLGATETADGLFAFPNCSMIDRLPNLAFAIDDKVMLEIEPRSYVLERKHWQILAHGDGDTPTSQTTVIDCYSGLVAKNDTEYPFWILGNIFLANFYTLFDYSNQRIGFTIPHSYVEPFPAARMPSFGRM
jgi:hypothetical protein